MLCSDCGSICTVPELFETKEKQRERYEMHNNSLNDEGYRKYLEEFIIPVFEEMAGQYNHKDMKIPEIQRILDYGSGPEPALCQLMTTFALEERFIKKTCEIRGWDPFFAPETPFFEGGADLVTCLEVAEHFETPLEDMKKLSSTLKSGGFAAIGTMLIPECKDSSIREKYGDDERLTRFKNWWYRSDITHVAFYTIGGLKKCAESAGLSFVKSVTDRAFLFRKTV